MGTCTQFLFLVRNKSELSQVQGTPLQSTLAPQRKMGLMGTPDKNFFQGMGEEIRRDSRAEVINGDNLAEPKPLKPLNK